MLIYRRVDSFEGSKISGPVVPYWRNPITGELQELTWTQVRTGRENGRGPRQPLITPASAPFYINDVPHVYSRMGWAPYYVQPVMKYTTPNQMKSDGTRITRYDIDNA